MWPSSTLSRASAPRPPRPTPQRSSISSPVEHCLATTAWERKHELTFALELHRAECEFLTGQLAAAEERLTMLSSRAANTIELATVTCLRVGSVLRLLIRAIARLPSVLNIFDIWASTGRPIQHEEEARREYERIWSQLGSRAIEELIELPLMSDPTSSRDSGCSDQGHVAGICLPMRTFFPCHLPGWSISASSMATATVRASPMYGLPS